MPQLKICGLRDQDNIADVLDLGPDYIGFIFHPASARYVEGQLDPAWVRELQGPRKVGVFVDAGEKKMREAAESYGLHALQLHGKESPQLCEKLQGAGLQLIKVFSVGESFDFERLRPYEGLVDYFLFDTRGKLPGGNGYAFDWKLLAAYPLEVPYFLSGGIGPENLAEALSLSDPRLHALDVNSRFESAPAFKDLNKLQLLFSQLNTIS
jgi:phosphoribosylanthranilate isomerase